MPSGFSASSSVYMDAANMKEPVSDWRCAGKLPKTTVGLSAQKVQKVKVQNSLLYFPRCTITMITTAFVDKANRQTKRRSFPFLLSYEFGRLYRTIFKMKNRDIYAICNGRDVDRTHCNISRCHSLPQHIYNGIAGRANISGNMQYILNRIWIEEDSVGIEIVNPQTTTQYQNGCWSGDCGAIAKPATIVAPGPQSIIFF